MKVQDDSAGGATEDDKKRQKRGGKGNIKTKKCKDDVPKKISVFRAPRSKKKSVTVITGLSTFDVDLKVAAKAFGAKFACGASVTGDDEIVVQGDVKDELFDFIPEKWPEVGFCCGRFDIYNCLPCLVLFPSPSRLTRTISRIWVTTRDDWFKRIPLFIFYKSTSHTNSIIKSIHNCTNTLVYDTFTIICIIKEYCR